MEKLDNSQSSMRSLRKTTFVVRGLAAWGIELTAYEDIYKLGSPRGWNEQISQIDDMVLQHIHVAVSDPHGAFSSEFLNN